MYYQFLKNILYQHPFIKNNQDKILEGHRSLNLKHNTEDVIMSPRKFRKHKGLVLALLLSTTKLTHASIRTPVRMPLTLL